MKDNENIRIAVTKGAYKEAPRHTPELSEKILERIREKEMTLIQFADNISFNVRIMKNIVYSKRRIVNTKLIFLCDLLEININDYIDE